MLIAVAEDLFFVYVCCRKYKSKEWCICCRKQPAKIRLCAPSSHHWIHFYCGKASKRSGVIHMKCFLKAWSVYINQLDARTPSSWWAYFVSWPQENDMLSWWLWIIQTCLRPMFHPSASHYKHPWGSHVSPWANPGSHPEFLNTTSGLLPHPPLALDAVHGTNSPSRCCESAWCHRT